MDVTQMATVTFNLHTALAPQGTPEPPPEMSDNTKSSMMAEGQPYMTYLIQRITSGGLHVLGWVADDGGGVIDLMKTDPQSNVQTRISYIVLPEDSIQATVKRVTEIFTRQVARDNWLYREMRAKEEALGLR